MLCEVSLRQERARLISSIALLETLVTDKTTLLEQEHQKVVQLDRGSQLGGTDTSFQTNELQHRVAQCQSMCQELSNAKEALEQAIQGQEVGYTTI